MHTFAPKPTQAGESVNAAKHNHSSSEQKREAARIPHLQRRISNQALEQSQDARAQETGNAMRAACACGGGCPRCAVEPSAHEHLQAKRVGANDSGEIAAPPVVHEALRASGQPLDQSTRELMESRFGHDFSQVRVHSDAGAGNAASAINARAFTVNRNIVFGANEYAPQTESGRRLLSHELMHVVQQRAGVHPSGGVGRAGDPYERQADEAADAVARNERVPSSSFSTGSRDHARPVVQRKAATDARQPDASTNAAATQLQASPPNSPCTFLLIVNGIVYCFVAKRTNSTDSSAYKLTAYATGAGASPVVYTANINIVKTNNKRSIVSNVSAAGEVEMMSPGQPSLLFLRRDITQAWDQMHPVSGLNWDYVVLEVYDENKRALPERKVFWMGGDWEELNKNPSPPVLGTQVATYRVSRGEVNTIYPGYYPSTTATNQPTTATTSAAHQPATQQIPKEKLSQGQLREIIENLDPKSTSSTGIDKGTYTGQRIKDELSAIQGAKSVKMVPWDEAAGKKVANTANQYHVSLPIQGPPKTIAARFKNNESLIPGGLMDGSFALLKEQAKFLILYLHENPDVAIEIHAHTDTRGTRDTNCTLSQARAESARKFMMDTTIWTGIGDIPKALTEDQIIMAQGEGQTEAEKSLKENHPHDWEAIIGTEAAAAPEFRRFDIIYIIR